VDAREDAEVAGMPDSLWSRLRRDPIRAPEHLALAAAERHGPAAAAWLAERRSFYADVPEQLARMAVKRHVNLARLSGAATGVCGIATVIPDVAALAWIQSRMVFFVAAAYGRDPCDPMRPAELLVLHEIYPDPEAARRALDGADKTIAEAWVGTRLSREEALYSSLARMAGRAATRRILGRAIPGFAIAANALGNARDTKALGRRATSFYAGSM
jgi:hypothetical protein